MGTSASAARTASTRTALRSAVSNGVKVLSAGVDRIRPPERGLAILAYHRVGAGTQLELDLETSVFAAQMAWLAESGRVRSLDDGIDELTGSDAGSNDPGSVVVTFDDGTADFVDNALPALVESGVPATYYIATAFIEEQRPFPDDGTPLTWTGLAEAVSTGLVTVGSHTHSHAVLDKLTPDQAEEELVRSSDLIGERLGVEAQHFAYPKGVFGGDENQAVLARHYRTAALANCSINPYDGSDLLRLDRAPVQRSDGMAYFERKVDGGLSFEGRLRSLLNERRYRSASN